MRLRRQLVIPSRCRTVDCVYVQLLDIYRLQVTLHQGAIESIFLDSMATMGVQVERPIVPTSIQLATDESVLKDPHSYAVTVSVCWFAAWLTEVEGMTRIGCIAKPCC